MQNWVMNIVMNFKEVILGLAIVNAIIALLLLVWPNFFIKLNNVLNIWIPTEKIEYALNKNRVIDPQIIKSRKIIGYLTVVLVIVLLFLYFKS